MKEFIISQSKKLPIKNVWTSFKFSKWNRSAGINVKDFVIYLYVLGVPCFLGGENMHGCRSAPTLLWVTTTYTLLMTVANEDSRSKLRNSTHNISPFTKIPRCQVAMSVWQVSGCNINIARSGRGWHDGWASNHKWLDGPVQWGPD